MVIVLETKLSSKTFPSPKYLIRGIMGDIFSVILVDTGKYTET